MDTAERLSHMLAAASIAPFEVGEITTYGIATDCRKPRASLPLTRGGQTIMTLLFDGSGDESPTEHAEVIRAMLCGAEVRLADAELRAANLSRALERRKVDLSGLERRLSDFAAEGVHRAVRGEFYAHETSDGAVWLCGRPASDAWGLRFASWHELATDRPGLRPCGFKTTDATYVVMRPIGDLAKTTEARP